MQCNFHRQLQRANAFNDSVIFLLWTLLMISAELDLVYYIWCKYRVANIFFITKK